MYKSMFSILIAACSFLYAAAMDVVCDKAGELQALISDTSIDNLVVSGNIDVRDIDFISSELSELVSLDLSGASISAYSCGRVENYFGHATEFIADELPRFCFFGKQYASVKLPTSLKSIGEGALGGMTLLSAIELPDKLMSINDYALAGSGIKQVKLPASVLHMGKGVFSSCLSLLNAEINVAVVGDEAFARCKALQSVTFGNKVTKIGDDAFAGCKALSTIEVNGKELKTIGARAFIDTALSGNPFMNCPSQITVGKWSFANTSIDKVYVSDNMTEMPEGVLFNVTNMQDIHIPDATTEIGDYALYNCKGVTVLTIPQNVEKLGDYAMSGMTGLNIIHATPIKVPSLGENVFASIDQPKVMLIVNNDSEDEYRAADQWREFSVSMSSGTDAPAGIITANVKAYFSGMVLNVQCDVEIARLLVVDASGRIMADKYPDVQCTTVDTGDWSGNLYIIRLVLVDGSSQVIKLVR